MDFNNNFPIYIQIMNLIKSDIVSGKISGGDKLPSVREYSKELKVNPNTVQRTYQELEREGLVFTQRGMGTFVTEDLDIIKSLKKDMASEIIHSFLGAIISEKKYGIEDEDILNAIRFHTTGRENMSDLEKIVFLADYIEPMRNFSGVDKARKLACEDLNKAMMYSLNNTILFLCNKDEYIALDTIKARNYILEIENEKIF